MHSVGLKPRVLESARQGHALGGIHVQEPSNEVLRCGRCKWTILLGLSNGEVRTLWADFCIDERAPVNPAFGNPSPNVPLIFVLEEWAGIREPDQVTGKNRSTRKRLSTDIGGANGGVHGEYDNTDTPAVYQVVVSLLVLLFDDFGSEVAWCTADGLQRS